MHDVFGQLWKSMFREETAPKELEISSNGKVLSFSIYATCRLLDTTPDAPVSVICGEIDLNGYGASQGEFAEFPLEVWQLEACLAHRWVELWEVLQNSTWVRCCFVKSSDPLPLWKLLNGR